MTFGLLPLHWARLGEPSKKARKEETKSKAERIMGHFSRRDFLKKAVPVIAGVGLAGALRIDPIFGATSNARPTQGTQLSTASYIVYYQDNFYAQNGTTGIVDYSGTDAATVIQAAIDALTEEEESTIYLIVSGSVSRFISSARRERF